MQTTTKSKDTKLVLKLSLIVAGMFGFGFALVPLYDVFCDITGINGKTNPYMVEYADVQVDQNRLITVEFLTRTQSGMPWRFESRTEKIQVYPGQLAKVEFWVKNPTDRNIVGQAIPSVSPGTGALYLNKTECFCFNQQPLMAGADALMPMQFYIDPSIPKEIETLTLSYTFFDVTQSSTLAMNR